MILHFHSTITPNSGELKRMRNIDHDITSVLNEKSVEVVTYDYKKKQLVNRDVLSEHVIKKYYIPLYGHWLIKYIILLLAYVYLSLKYHPSCVIFEMFIRLHRRINIIKIITPKCKLIYDIHGASAEEWAYQGKSEEEVNKKRSYEGEMVKSVDYVICQSEEMKRYIIEQYQINEQKICVYRCGVDTSKFMINEEQRAKIRSSLGVNIDERLFVYSGGLHPWQRVEDSVLLFENIHQQNNHTKLLVLTADTKQYERVLLDLGIDNQDGHIMTKALSFDEVPLYLNACDYGFLLRHLHKMNAVASPTKLAEYLACGLVVITDEVAKYWVNDDGFQYLYFVEKGISFDALEEIRNKLSREEIFNYANSYLSLKVDYQNMMSFFKEDITLSASR